MTINARTMFIGVSFVFRISGPGRTARIGCSLPADFCPAHLQWKDYWIAVGFFQPPLLLQPLFVQPRAAESPLLVLTGMVFPSFLENISIFFMFSPLFRLKYILESADPQLPDIQITISKSQDFQKPGIRKVR